MAEALALRKLLKNSSEIVRRLEQGESFIVPRNGIPVGELTPRRRPPFVPTTAVVAIFGNAPSIDADRFRTDIDAWAEQNIPPSDPP